MATFEERMGLKPIRLELQTVTLDDRSRLRLWNKWHAFGELVDERVHHEVRVDFYTRIWTNTFARPRDEFPGTIKVWKIVKDVFLTREYGEALGLLEDLVQLTSLLKDYLGEGITEVVVSSMNEFLESELIGYRFVGVELTPLDHPIVVDAVNNALDAVAGKYQSTHANLEAAIKHLSDRDDPHYKSAITESVSAVEALARELTGARTLGDAIKEFDRRGINVHPALKRSWLDFYGWASDAYRHGRKDMPETSQSLAKYAVVTSAAFISYLVEESDGTE